MRVAIIFHRLGPYHHARLLAVAKVCDLTVIELSRVDSTYAWSMESSMRPYLIRTLFEEDYADVCLSEARRRLLHTLKVVSPDILAIPGWSGAMTCTALEWCQLSKRPAILMSASTLHDFPRRWWREWIKGRLVGLAAAALVGGTPHREYITRLGMPRERTFLGYDVVDNAYFTAAADVVRDRAESERARLGLPAAFFLGSNRFIEKKNIPALVEAYDRYRQTAGDGAWHLVLLGDGPLRPAIEAIIQQRGLGDLVHLPGFKQYDELPAYYGLAGAFVHASTTEQWGLVINEAMAAGLPVLVSNRCGCALDLVAEGENGYTFDPLDVTALTERMLDLASPTCDRALMARRSREIITHWSPETFATGMMDAATKALNAPRKAFRIHDQMLIKALIRRR